MGHPGYGGALDTPRTNIGDATYLSRQPDFAEISQELSFQSPQKDGNLFQQLRNGRVSNLRTPRRRGPLADRQNLPQNVGGAEFTPLLKSHTRDSERKPGKENGLARAMATPLVLNRIEEDDLTPLPPMDASMYTGSRNQSYLDKSLPQVEASSAASTPIALPARRKDEGKGPLNNGRQLSLREQEEEINKIEKLNFSLKLKIHFLEEALRKAGPGFNEAALKENTELKIDAKLMERDMKRYKKHLTHAERDLEAYRQQVQELQDKNNQLPLEDSSRDEVELLRRQLDEREALIEKLQSQLEEGQQDNEQVQKLRDDIGDLETELRARDGLLADRDEELEDLRDKCDEAEERAKDAERKMLAMEESKEDNEDLEHELRRMEEQLEEAKEKAEDALAEKKRAEDDLAELQEELADKSMVTKGLSRQVEEKVVRLQSELDDSEQAYADLEKQLAEANRSREDLENALSELKTSRQSDESTKDIRIRDLEAELQAQADEKDVLESRKDELAGDIEILQTEVQKLEQEVAELEANLEEERQHAIDIEKSARNQQLDEIERLNDEISDLQAEIREKDNLYDTDSDKWETEKQTLESELERIEERAAGLQRTIDKLREAEGNLSSQETKLQHAMQSEVDRHQNEESLLNRRIDELQDALESRQSLLTDLRSELATVRDELRQAAVDGQSQTTKTTSMEAEIEVLQKALETSKSQQKDLVQARSERDNLRHKLEIAQRVSPAKSPRVPRYDEAAAARTKWQLSDVTSQLEQATKEKQTLRDQLASVNLELHTCKSALDEARAERDEFDAELRRAMKPDSDMTRTESDRVEMRTIKVRLEGEVRRLKDDNRALEDQRDALEKTMDEEMNKAALEEDRLNEEVRQLQAKIRTSSTTDSYELTAARRKIRELERQIDDHEGQMAALIATTNGEKSVSDLSMTRKDLLAARQKELEFLSRESTHRETVKTLKHQIADLENQLHDKEVAQMMTSPSSMRDAPLYGDSAQVRQQLSTLRQSMADMKIGHREAERKFAEQVQDLKRQLEDTEDQKIVLEELLDDARQEIDEISLQHERALERLQLKLDQAVRDRDEVKRSASTNSKADRHLRKSQAEIENLEHDVRQQQEMLDALAVSEGSLRRKLERSRSERTALRSAAEKLKREFGKLKRQREQDNNVEAFETVVRAAEGAKTRHEKELRGAVLQMEWMQARWEREASLRCDVAYAKKFVQLQLNVADACNKAQLRELESIRTRLLGSRAPLPQTTRGAAAKDKAGKPSLRNVLMAARFIARMRIASRAWAKQEVVKKQLVDEIQGQRRAKRSRQFRVVAVGDLSTA